MMYAPNKQKAQMEIPSALAFAESAAINANLPGFRPLYNPVSDASCTQERRQMP